MTETIFNPDWVSPPGETIRDILKERNLSATDFAQRIGYVTEELGQLLQGQSLITIETARKLEVVLGASAAFWMLRDSQYREALDRSQGENRNQRDARWLIEIPTKQMIKFGWIRSYNHPRDQAEECLRFFGVTDINEWRRTYQDILQMAAFRTSATFQSQPGALATWLRQAEIQAGSVDCRPWDARGFRDVLCRLRSLTRRKDPRVFLPELINQCASCGVAVVVVRAPIGCRASGATRFISQSKALLVLSFRYLSDDHFWFTFFHEAGHLLLHGKKAIFLEGISISSAAEDEANEFAANTLIPTEFKSELLNLRTSSLDVIRFSRRVGVSPGIVVGQLQHLQRVRRNQLNGLKRRFAWDVN